MNHDSVGVVGLAAGNEPEKIIEYVSRTTAELVPRLVNLLKRTEEFMAAAAGHREDDTRLRKVVGGRKTPLEHDSATTAEHPLRVPPPRRIHLAVASDD